ncbi:MAG: hypothetical protein ABIA75_13775 [Candidatus Neomarinimicrobiota bacterium]
MRQALIITLVPLLLILGGCRTAPQASFPVLSGPYLGQSTPGADSQIFAEGIVSTAMYERDVAVLPDGKEFYYGLLDGNYAVIVESKLVNGRWTEPELAPFSSNPQFRNLEPHIAPDGQKFFFLSTRPQEGQEAKPGWTYQDIWAMDRTADGWSEPYNLGPPVNTDEPEYYPSVTAGGTLYFTRGTQNQYIYRARLVDGRYAEPEKLPEQVNASGMQYNACIAPDESYLIVCTRPASGAIGRADYCVCFRSADDRWSPPINLGPKVNTPGCSAMSPFITADGKYFFFSSQRQRPLSPVYSQEKFTLQDLKDEFALDFSRPGNGYFDIYWMDTSLIDSLKQDYYGNN